MSSKKKETIYLSVSLTNISMWLWCLHDSVLFRLLFEPALELRKTNKGCGCVEKVIEGKISIQYIKNNLQQLKEIAVFIIQIIVVPENCDNWKSHEQMPEVLNVNLT